MATKKTIEAAVPKFTKAALLKAKKYAYQKDVLNALLKDDQEYTAKEVAGLVENFLKGKVD